MAKINSTESFIAAAIALHGNRYDYSNTKWESSRSPIEIRCRVCGPVVLAEPRSHLRPDKLCGCKTCNRKSSLRKAGRLHVCPICRKWAAYKSSLGVCGECHQRRMDQRASKASALLSRPCPVCGDAINKTDAKAKTCSAKCGSALHSTVFDVPCETCGVPVPVKPSMLKRQSQFTCSRECYAVLKRVLDAPAREKRDAIKRSLKAKSKWKKEHRQKRIATSEYCQWRILCLPSRWKRKYVNEDPWRTRCNTASSTLSHRTPSNNHSSRIATCKTWKQAISSQSRAIRARARLCARTPWQVKCTSVARNMRRRLPD